MDNYLRSQIIVRTLFRDSCVSVLMENGRFVYISKILNLYYLVQYEIRITNVLLILAVILVPRCDDIMNHEGCNQHLLASSGLYDL
jgi:hypothetical protein